MPSLHFGRYLVIFSLNILILRLKTLLILYPRIETPLSVLPCCQPNIQLFFRSFGATTKRPTEETENKDDFGSGNKADFGTEIRPDLETDSPNDFH